MLYLVRRHLGFSVKEWKTLPWHEQMVYLEGLHGDFYQTPDGEDQSVPPDIDDSEVGWASLTGMGANPQQV